MGVISLNVGDKVVSKKNHPCGGNGWEVIRTGADFKFKCEKCGRIIMLSAEDVSKFVKRKVENV